MRKQSIVAERLRKLRESVGLTQVKLAENFEGIDQPAVYRYEGNKLSAVFLYETVLTCLWTIFTVERIIHKGKYTQDCIRKARNLRVSVI